MRDGGSRRAFFGATIDEAFARFIRRIPRQSRSRLVVESVLEAFDREIKSSGPEEVTIESLSDRAGVGPGSFYEYFNGKDSLVGAFIGRVTRENFDKLAAELSDQRHERLDDLVHAFARATVSTYVAHPKRMRLLVDGITRFGLLHTVNRERDRFAKVMTSTAQVFYPDVEARALEESMRFLADAAMGVLVSCTSRDEATDDEALSMRLAEMGLAVMRARHGEPRRRPTSS